MKIFAIVPLLFYVVTSEAFPTSEVVGEWNGEVVTSFLRVRKTLPDYYRVTSLTMRIDSSSKVRGKTGNGCLFEGMVMRTSTLTFPIKGLIIDCPHERMNGYFEGVINYKGDMRLLVRDKSLGRSDIYGRLSKPAIREKNE